MTRGARLLGLAALVLLVADVGVISSRLDRPPGPDARRGDTGQVHGPAAPDPAQAAARRFLSRYVEASGRVVRHDQGGDTVSEGQAYALLLAVALDDRSTFDRVWSWTSAHLGRPDGLLAWRWAGGRIADDEPAADADLDAAWALTLAADRWPDRGYHAAAATLARAVEAREVAPLPDGRPILVPGPWARERVGAGTALVVNPSYSSPTGEAALVAAGHLAAASSAARLAAMRDLVAAQVDQGGVPTDWLVVRADGTPHGISGPDATSDGRFGWDAARVPLRLAVSCDPDDRTLAARMWPAIVAGHGTDRMGDHPARLVAAAAAAAAADQPSRALGLLERASAAEAGSSTYYGCALTALGWTLLTTDRLGGCAPLR